MEASYLWQCFQLEENIIANAIGNLRKSYRKSYFSFCEREEHEYLLLASHTTACSILLFCQQSLDEF